MNPSHIGYDFNKIFDSTQENGINRYEVIKLCNFLSDLIRPYNDLYINEEIRQKALSKYNYVIKASESPLVVELKNYDLINKACLHKYINKTIKFKNIPKLWNKLDKQLNVNKDLDGDLINKTIDFLQNSSIDKLMFEVIENPPSDELIENDNNNNKIKLILNSPEAGLTKDFFEDCLGELHGFHRERLVITSGEFEFNQYSPSLTCEKALGIVLYLYIIYTIFRTLSSIFIEIYNDLNFELEFEDPEEIDYPSTEDLLNSLESLEITRMLSTEDAENPVDSNDPTKNNDESDSEEDEDKKGKMIRKIKNGVMRAPVQVKTFINKMRLFLHNRKSVFFYKKVLGKIDTLYENYGAEAVVDECKFRDDPVLVLRNTICPNIIRIGKEMAQLCDEVEGMTKKCAHASSKDQVIQIGEDWAKKLPDLTLAGEKMEKLTLKKRILFSTRTRMVDILLKQEGFKIPNYTRESMIVKELPTPNHYIISYMLINPQEKPGNYPVEAIFKSADSFRIMANAEKNDIFHIGEMSNAVLKNKLDAATFEKMEERFNKLQNTMKQSSADEEEVDKEKDKLYKQVIDGFKKSMEVMVKQKIYIAHIINMYGNLIQRTDQLAIRCIRAMLSVEAEKADPRYKGQMKRQKSIYKTDNTEKTATVGDYQVRRNAEQDIKKK